MCKAHSGIQKHCITKIGIIKKKAMGGRGMDIYKFYCFLLVSSILNPQDGMMTYYCSSESLMKCLSI